MGNFGKRGIFHLTLISSLFFALIYFAGCHEKENPANSTPKDPVRGEGWTFKKSSGDLQSVRAHDTLSHRMVACLLDASQNPVVFEPVTFTVVRGYGQVIAKVSPSDIQEVQTITDWSGNASGNFQFFGSDGSQGAMLVSATVDSFPNLTVTFTIYPPK